MERVLQARTRMRTSKILYPAALQVHVVEAIRDSDAIDKDDLYGKVLREVREVEGAQAVVGEVASIVKGIATGTSRGIDIKLVEATRAKVRRLFVEAAVCIPSAEVFNSRFLNGNGLGALAAAITFDLLDLDPGEFDASVGGVVKEAAYGPRQTRRQRRWGPKFQRLLKTYESVEEDAIRHAASCYLVYRYRCEGRWRDYEVRMELAGQPSGGSQMREWFRDFDEAFGFPPPRRGRPPIEDDRRNQIHVDAMSLLRRALVHQRPVTRSGRSVSQAVPFRTPARLL